MWVLTQVKHLRNAYKMISIPEDFLKRNQDIICDFHNGKISTEFLIDSGEITFGSGSISILELDINLPLSIELDYDTAKTIAFYFLEFAYVVLRFSSYPISSL